MTVKSTSNNKNNIRPFLKWAGNKYRIIDRVREALPQGKRLIEPFAGSAAVFLNTNYERYLVSDSNPDLINLFNCVKDEGEDFIKYCKRFFTEIDTDITAYVDITGKEALMFLLVAIKSRTSLKKK